MASSLGRILACAAWALCIPLGLLACPHPVNNPADPTDPNDPVVAPVQEGTELEPAEQVPPDAGPTDPLDPEGEPILPGPEPGAGRTPGEPVDPSAPPALPPSPPAFDPANAPLSV